MLGSRQKVQSDNNTSNVNADDNVIAIADNDDDHYHSVLPVLLLLLHTFRRDMLYVSGQQEKLRIRRVCNAKLVTEKKKKKKRVSPRHKVATNFCVTCVANFNRNYSHVDTLTNVTGKKGSEVDSSTTHTHTHTHSTVPTGSSS